MERVEEREKETQKYYFFSLMLALLNRKLNKRRPGHKRYSPFVFSLFFCRSQCVSARARALFRSHYFERMLSAKADLFSNQPEVYRFLPPIFCSLQIFLSSPPLCLRGCFSRRVWCMPTRWKGNIVVCTHTHTHTKCAITRCVPATRNIR